jgi:hypothetical protein
LKKKRLSFLKFLNRFKDNSVYVWDEKAKLRHLEKESWNKIRLLFENMWDELEKKENLKDYE